MKKTEPKSKKNAANRRPVKKEMPKPADSLVEMTKADTVPRLSEIQACQQLEEFQPIYDSIPFGLCVLDRSLRYVLINQYLAELNGVPASEHIGRTPREIVQAFAPLIEEVAERAFQTGEPVLNVEFSGATPSHPGVQRTFLAHWLPLKNADGNIFGINLVLEEITNLKRADEALRKSEERFRQLANSTFEGILIYDKGVILDVNQALTRLTGYDYEEAIGKSVFVFIAPESRELVLQRMQNPSVAPFEISLIKKDGTPCLMEVAARDITYEGKAARVVALRDITESKRVEQELQKSERLYRAIGESIDYGIWICDPDGRNIYASESFLRMVGITQEQCSNFGWGDVLHPEDAERTIAAWKECVRIRGKWDIVHRFRGVDGHWHHVLARGIPILDEKGQVICWAGINLDISEEKEIEQQLLERTSQLQAVNEELESFSYSVSHDLRAPLRAIDGYARMLLKKHGHEFDEDSMRKFNVIRSSTHMMGQLIDDLLTFSRLSRKNISTSKIDMEALIRDVWKELQGDTEGRKINLTVNSMPSGYGDRALIKQVYTNLLSNAVKFTKFRDPALIEVGGYVDGNDDIYYVKDNGVGFDMTYYDKLFGVFQRLHKADEFEGTGIGLATVQRIIRRHGGKVWAEGKEGEGAIFYFSLPPPQTH